MTLKEVTQKTKILEHYNDYTRGTKSAEQISEAVNVTSTDPPHASGAFIPLLSTITSHPPLADTRANHAKNAASTVAWSHGATIVSAGRFNDKSSGDSTVNSALLITLVSQSLVTVHVTSTDPPQILGAPVLSSAIAALQPPENDVRDNQSSKAASTLC